MVLRKKKIISEQRLRKPILCFQRPKEKATDVLPVLYRNQLTSIVQGGGESISHTLTGSHSGSVARARNTQRKLP